MKTEEEDRTIRQAQLQQHRRSADGGRESATQEEQDDPEEGRVDPDDLEAVVRNEERQAGEILHPDAEETATIENRQYYYYDIETYETADQLEHVANLVVVQSADGQQQQVFRGQNCIDEFCRWASVKRPQPTTFVAHNAKRYDSYFVMNWLIRPPGTSGTPSHLQRW